MQVILVHVRFESRFQNNVGSGGNHLNSDRCLQASAYTIRVELKHRSQEGHRTPRYDLIFKRVPAELGPETRSNGSGCRALVNSTGSLGGRVLTCTGRLPSPGASGPGQTSKRFSRTSGGNSCFVLLRIHHFKKWKTNLFFDPSQRISP